MNFTDEYFAGAQKALMKLFKQARPELLEYHGKIEFETKEDKSVVTRLDKEMELKVKEVLHDFDSSVGFWGEEYGKEGNEQTYWLIDPIDNTESLIRGLGASRNIVTFVDNEKPLFALVYRFVSDDLFIGQKNKPTLKNGQPVKLSDRPLDRSWLEFSVNMRLPDGYQIYQDLRPQIAGITVHRDFLEIMEGGIEGIVVYKSAGREWDYAPRALLIEGAGGRVTNIGSDKYDIHDFNVIATTDVIFDDVAGIVNKAIAKV